MADGLGTIVRDARRLIRERPAVVVGGGLLLAVGATLLSRQAETEGEAEPEGEAPGAALGQQTPPEWLPAYNEAPLPPIYSDGGYTYPEPTLPPAPTPLPIIPTPTPMPIIPTPTPTPTVGGCGPKPATPPPRGWRWVCTGTATSPGRWILQPLAPPPTPIIPTPTPTPTPGRPRAPARPVYYVVRRGDTLSAIARRFKTTVARLLRLNPQITNRNLIRVGQRIRVR